MYKKRPGLTLEPNITLLVSRTDWREYLNFAETMADRRPDITTILLHRDSIDAAGMHMLYDRSSEATPNHELHWLGDLLREMKRRLEAERGIEYPGKASPSSGFVALFFLLQICQRVDVYGVGVSAHFP